MNMEMIDTTTDTGGYILGLLWSTAHWNSSQAEWRIQSKEMFPLEAISQVMNVGTPAWLPELAVYQCRTQTNIQLREFGWKPMLDPGRTYPTGIVNNRGFIRAWVEMNSSVGKFYDSNSVKRKRITVSGRGPFLKRISEILSPIMNGPRKLQVQPVLGDRKTKTVTYLLRYSGRHYDTLLDWLYSEAEIWSPAARAKLEFSENK